MSKDKSEIWTKVIADWESSGLSQVGFCKVRGLKLSTFYGWKSRLKNRGPIPVRQNQADKIKISHDKPSRFVEAVMPRTGELPVTPQSLILKVGERFSLKLEPEFNETLLLKTLKILAQL